MANRAVREGMADYGCEVRRYCGEPDGLADRLPGLVLRAIAVRKEHPTYTLADVWMWAQLSQW